MTWYVLDLETKPFTMGSGFSTIQTLKQTKVNKNAQSAPENRQHC